MQLPGTAPFPVALAERLAAAGAAPGGGADGARFTNRLALETSTYLLQHAHNPVNWYPWGDEPFEEARRTGRPVFLSVGYATCHWCHVMERESFEDLEIARFLNEHYVAIKVDREERPDVDAVYMAAVQALTGSGGWPMSVWLTADREPFFGGTYFPARDGDRGAVPGFASILQQIAEVYRHDQSRIRNAGAGLTLSVKNALASSEGPSPALPGPEPIERAVELFGRLFDDRCGGLRGAPKFPSSLPVRLLLRVHRRARDPRALHMAELTLEKMAAGGIFDQLGGGFHRYSTDADWLVPHFEKMLYDNALLALAYAEAWQVTKRPAFARVTRDILDWALREMRTAEGAFASATDADSEGVEGKFFLWSEEEVRRILGEQADRFLRFYRVEPVLHVPRPDEVEWRALEPERRMLFAAREERVRPLRDGKVLAGWNGLMISALAFGGRVFAEPRWVSAAARAAEFILGPMRPGGRLMRSDQGGRPRIPAYLEDHAFLAQGLFELYEATFEVRWLVEALALCEKVEELFADRAAGGWFRTGEDQETLIAREKPGHDGAEPCGASVALGNALRLAAFTADDRWRAVAERALRFYAPALAEEPAALSEMLLALDFFTDAPREVVLVWPGGAAPPSDFLEVLRNTFLPNRALAGAAEESVPELCRVAPVACEKVAVGGRTTAYVCERGRCRLPAIEPEKLAAQVLPVKPLR